MKGKSNKTKEEVNQSVSQLTSHITVIHILSNAKLKHQLQSARLRTLRSIKDEIQTQHTTHAITVLTTRRQ